MLCIERIGPHILTRFDQTWQQVLGPACLEVVYLERALSVAPAPAPNFWCLAVHFISGSRTNEPPQSMLNQEAKPTTRSVALVAICVC